jgi:anti-sigma regulatory factor (Ser/Thr protein kinase)
MVFQRQLAADLNKINEVVGALRGWADSRGLGHRSFVLELLTREALVNAVRHGSGGDAQKMVSLSLWFAGDRLILEVADDGPGFNWREAACRQPDERAEGGRGLAIMRHYARQVEFNEKGNRVRLIL